MQGEETLEEARTHFKILVKPLFIQIILLGVHFLAWKYLPGHYSNEWMNSWLNLIVHGIIVLLEVVYVIVPFIRWRTSTFTLTNHRVIKEWGILNRESREIMLDHIVSIRVERSIIDRIFGAGTLIFFDASAARSGQHKGKRSQRAGLRFIDVPHAQAFKQKVEEAQFGSKKES